MRGLAMAIGQSFFFHNSANNVQGTAIFHVNSQSKFHSVKSVEFTLKNKGSKFGKSGIK
jgi:hypothetical protein